MRSRCWHDTAYGATVVAEQEQSPGGCEACRNAGTMSSAVSGAASVAPWCGARDETKLDGARDEINGNSLAFVPQKES